MDRRSIGHSAVMLPAKAALKNNFSSEAGTTEARTPEKQAFLANLRWIAEVIFERRQLVMIDTNAPHAPEWLEEFSKG